MKKSILLSTVLVCISVIAFGQAAPAAPKAQTNKMSSKDNAAGQPTTTQTTPAALTGPTPGTSSNSTKPHTGAKPTTGTRWKGAKAHGPAAKVTPMSKAQESK